MKAVMMTDIEGAAGVVSFDDQGYADGIYYEQAKKILTAEINAAVAGLVEAGVNDVIVIDGHGPGAIIYEDLKSPAKLLHGRPYPRKEVLEITAEYDVAVMIGQHAMAGTQLGNMNHTQSSKTIEYYKLNGHYIGEIAQWALKCGALGLPMIFLSGDEAACNEAQELIQGITTAAVKKGLSRAAAISLAQSDAHKLIKDSIKEAIEKQKTNPILPLKWKGPYVLEKRFFFTETADIFKNNPLYEQIDTKTVQIKSDNILEIIYS